MKALRKGKQDRSGKPVESQALVDAFINRDRKRLGALTVRVGEDHPLRPYFVALCDAADLRQKDLPERDKAIVERLLGVLEPPPPDAEAFAIILATLVVAAWHSGRVHEARKAYRALAQMEESVTRPLPRALILGASAQMETYAGNFIEAGRLASTALDLLPERSAVLRYGLLALRAEAARMAGNFDVAERDLAELERLGEAGSPLRVSLAFLRCALLHSSGRVREALALCDQLPEVKRRGTRGMVMRRKALLLLLAGRVSEAEGIVRAEAECLMPFDCERLKALAALARGDFDGARALARSAVILAGSVPARTDQSVSLLAQIELAAHRPRVARMLLETIGRSDEAGGRCFLWVRLHLQEGDFERAVRQFRRFPARNRPDALRKELLFAYELSGHDLARLQMAADDTETTAGPTAPRSEEEPDAVVPDGGSLVGETAAMRRVREDIDRLAPLKETVLLSGETGTGKDLVARILHEQSGRAAEPFIVVNCGAISDTLIESELFGHVKGAFTGAAADHEGLFTAAGKGTIFLDEIASMSARLQAALLRVLETGEVRPVGSARSRPVACRVVAATNRDLEEMVKEGQFRSDLYYRLERLRIHLPPLRERRDDVPILARHFLGRHFASGEVALGDDLAEALMRHDWPGNVRELRNAVERMAILSGGSRVLGVELFPQTVGAQAAGKLPPVVVAGGESTSQIPGGGSGTAVVSAARAMPPAEPWRRPGRDRQDRLREFFVRHRDLSRSEVAQLLNCAPKTAAHELERLRAEGLIERVEPTRSHRTHYFRLRPASPEAT